MELLKANDRSTYMTDLDKCQKKMTEKGYSEQFQVTEEGLKAIETGHIYSPPEVKVNDFFRFEGISDPDDMSILYAIETADGHKGTLVDAYGLYADDDISQFMAGVEEIHKKVTKS
ncbi:MAG TPA: phosphoribosylpyrophosphate synthetase [Chitinophagaceae bacterium]